MAVCGGDVCVEGVVLAYAGIEGCKVGLCDIRGSGVMPTVDARVNFGGLSL